MEYVGCLIGLLVLPEGLYRQYDGVYIGYMMAV